MPSIPYKHVQSTHSGRFLITFFHHLFQVLPEVKELVVLRQSNTDVILQLARTMVPITVEKGEIVAQQGQPDDSMYIIAEVQFWLLSTDPIMLWS